MYPDKAPSVDLREFVIRAVLFITGFGLTVSLVSLLLWETEVSWFLLAVTWAVLLGFTMPTLISASEKAEKSNSYLRTDNIVKFWWYLLDYVKYIVIGFFFPLIGIFNLIKWLGPSVVSLFNNISKCLDQGKTED